MIQSQEGSRRLMKLHEFEGKKLISSYNIPVPNGTVISSLSDLHKAEGEVVKAQLLTVKSRGKLGAVKVLGNSSEAKKEVERILNKKFLEEEAELVLIEEKVNVKKEYYLGILYDTKKRMPVIVFSKQGGIDIEELAMKKPDEILKMHVDFSENLKKNEIKKKFNISDEVAEIILNAWNCFLKEDLKLLEMNPLAETESGYKAIDVSIEIDDDAAFRHKERSYQRKQTLTEREKKVKEIDKSDYRGTVKYMDLDGDIGFLAAGGGGSITCMDALLNAGGNPANYTEYSGNPSEEKVYHLTKQILSKPLNGLWIVGAIANFTRMDTTMQGVIKALAEEKPKFPIIVRRSGPFEKEGIEILKNASKEHNLDMTIYGKEMPMTKSAEILVEKVKKYKKRE